MLEPLGDALLHPVIRGLVIDAPFWQVSLGHVAFLVVVPVEVDGLAFGDGSARGAASDCASESSLLTRHAWIQAFK
jgi:hypothetical protein